jgi:hypothetical protein
MRSRTYDLNNIDKVKLEDYDRVIIPGDIGDFTFKCCDCGLSHKVYFKICKNKVIARLVRQ